ncbi:alpha/beta fold hydrolase [Agromyces larvae]|uniref:Alpha/beta hydrolase n=1 Tax=Agromyces larvae TaxID=2929802 RepID=A0ABY4BZK3_9MICO|nr:alpha/beta hydrolase [Agromyces larvae]UOE43291.1 alpha/beta hydrolase [Agromyces larvae]
MHPTVVAVLATARTAERVSPVLAARVAQPLFTATRPPMRVRDGDRAVHAAARITRLRVRDRDALVYEWGHGAEVVLLAHGWRGRASQFGSIVRELRSDGYRVVAFDAPANGDAPGRRADIRDWLAVIEELQRRHGRFRAIVGHSFGAVAAHTAVREGVATGGVVAIAGMSAARFVVDAFAAGVGLGTPTADQLASRFARIVLGDDDARLRRFDDVANPLPSDVPLLLVHDRDDREVPVGEAVRVHEAHGERSRLVVTTGGGHNRVLGLDATLDAVNAFVAGGLDAVDASGPRQPAAVHG